MRIAYLADPDSNNGFYRGQGPMAALEQCRGHRVRRLSADERVPPLADVRDIDVLHIHRYADERAQRLVREAKAHGAAIVWDNDDDIGSLPKNTPAYKTNGGVHWQRRLAGMKKIFALADLVTTPSRTLAARLQSDGARAVEVIENHVPDQFLDVERRPHDGVIVGWVAGRSHHVDVDLVPFKAALQRLLDERPEVHVVTIGLGIGIRHERYHASRFVPLLSLPKQTSQLDVGIAPIADIDFNRARSNIKVKEYAAGGAAWLASPIGPYAGMGEQEGGRLVPDDRWYEELIRLVDKPKDRRKLAKRARKWIEGQTLTRHVDAWERAIERAVRSARAGATSSG
jgi:glycosyltransferase involved in cell wall biosynthesis